LHHSDEKRLKHKKYSLCSLQVNLLLYYGEAEKNNDRDKERKKERKKRDKVRTKEGIRRSGRKTENSPFLSFSDVYLLWETQKVEFPTESRYPQVLDAEAFVTRRSRSDVTCGV
jgi:DNA polymerase sigma